jgi:glc operon protein GlcG
MLTTRQPQNAFYPARRERLVPSQSIRQTVLRFAVLFALCSVRLAAQMPIPYGESISLEAARKPADAALAEAAKNKWAMAVAIVDPSGNLVYYEKMDNTQLASAAIAIDKARAAVLYKRPTKAMQDALAAGGNGLRVLSLRDAMPIEGGIPLVMDGKIVGAIGVSGDASEHDNQCATAGAALLK